MNSEAKERTDTQRVADVFDSLTRVRFELAAVEAASRGAEDADESRGVTSIINRLRWQVGDARDTLIDVHDRLRENGASPPEPSGGLTLSEDEVWALGVDLWRIAYASLYPMNHEMEGAKSCPDAVIALANRLCDYLFERAGVPRGDATNKRLSDDAHPFGEKAAKMGADAVETAALEEVES